MTDDNPRLSRLERYFLSNQLRILEALYPDEADSLAVRREAIERGYEFLYGWDMEHIYSGDDVMTPEESAEVWETLDMFDAIERSSQTVGPENLDGFHFKKFAGYDGNNESKFMSFAAFTVERLGRFQYIQTAKAGYWNSHAPVRAIYQRMLEVWQRIPRERRFDLSLDQLREILGAAVHPDNRGV